jgi:hypothetical protein
MGGECSYVDRGHILKQISRSRNFQDHIFDPLAFSKNLNKALISISLGVVQLELLCVVSEYRSQEVGSGECVDYLVEV